MIASPPRQGAISRAWSRLFGARDPIERQLDAVAREGEGLARVAHACAVLMLILFSAGSLVALAGDSVAAIVAGHASIPAAISTGVSGLLVACMDTGMIYAASQLRLLASRRQRRGGWLHRIVLGCVSALESGTYVYMSARFEAPNNGAAWVLIVARAVAAPLLSVYLSLARALPVTGADILQLSERLAAEGVLRDIAHIASDTSASLADKLAIYAPVAVNAPEDDARLARLFEAAQKRAESVTPDALQSDGVVGAASHDRPPTGPGSPIGASKRRRSGAIRPGATPLHALPRVAIRPAAAVTASVEKPSAEERIYAYLEAHPRASIRTLERRCGVASSTASKHRALWLAARASAAGDLAQ